MKFEFLFTFVYFVVLLFFVFVPSHLNSTPTPSAALTLVRQLSEKDHPTDATDHGYGTLLLTRFQQIFKGTMNERTDGEKSPFGDKTAKLTGRTALLTMMMMMPD